MPQNSRRLRPLGRTSFALVCLLCAALAITPVPAARSAPPTARAAYDCEGGACASVTLTWEEEGQRFRVDNSAARRVRVTVTTFAGESWVVVEPQASAYLGVKNFNRAYRAEFE